MKKIVKIGMFAFLGVTMSAGIVSCSDPDPNYETVVPPTVSVSNSITGRVTNMDGTVLAATVKLDGNAVQTKTDGTFAFENVTAGNHTITAEASGKITKEMTVTVAAGNTATNTVCNFALANVGTTVTVEANTVTEKTVESETITGNEAGKVKIDVEVPANTLPEGSTIIITPLYSMDEAASGRAQETVTLIGTEVKCSDPNAQLQQPISLTYDIDASVSGSISVLKLVNNQWVNAAYTVNGNKVTVEADQLTSYVINLVANVTTANATEQLSFERSLWDNLYGGTSITVDNASYTYHMGTEISASANNKVCAYLKEIVARRTGSSVATVTGTYPLNVTLPFGTALRVSGTQEVETVTVSALSGTATGRQYGTVSIKAEAFNREHTGGSN